MSKKEIKKLNLGCGIDIRKDYINLDSIKLKGVDVVWDIEKLPLPFKDNEFDEILCKDILEHVEYIPLLKEIYRILKKRGKLIISVPHFSSVNNFIDPTHKKRFSIQTFEFFIKNSKWKRNYYFNFHFDKIKKAKITFSKKWYFLINFLIEPLINLCYKTKLFYEKSGLTYLFPAVNIELELIK